MEDMDPTLLIRKAQKSDVEDLSALAMETYSDAFGHTMSTADLSSHLQKNLSPACFSRFIEEDVVLVGEISGRLLGYVQFGKADSSKTNQEQELRRLYVHRDFQNRGFGSALMDAALRQLEGAACISLDVWEHNHGAQRFYRRYGFEVTGTRPFAVTSGSPTSLDLVMVRRAAQQGETASTGGRSKSDRTEPRR